MSGSKLLACGMRAALASATEQQRMPPGSPHLAGVPALLGGRWAVALPIWIIQSLAGLWVFHPRAWATEMPTTTRIVVGAIVGALGAGLILYLAHVSVLKHRRERPAPLAIVVTVWISAAVAKVTVESLVAFGTSLPTNFIPVALGLTLNNALWAALLTYLFAIATSSRQAALHSVEDVNMALGAHHEVQMRLERERLATAERMETSLIAELATLRARILAIAASRDSAAWRDLADRVSGVTIEQVRSASEGITTAGAKIRTPPVVPPIPAPWWRDVPGNLLAISPAPVLTTLVLAASGFQLLVSGSALGYLGQAAVLAGLFFIVLSLGSLAGRLASEWPYRGIPTVLTYALGGVALYMAVSLVPGLSFPPISSLSLPILMAASVLVGVGASVVQQSRGRWEAATAAQVASLGEFADTTQRLRQADLRLRRQSADLLHGPVQAQLAAVSLALRLQAENLEDATSDDAQADATLAICSDLLDRVTLNLATTKLGPHAVQTPIRTALEGYRADWLGLIDVSFSMDQETEDAVDKSPWTRAPLESVIQEGITNASKHGDARHVHVALELASGPAVAMMLVDDGSGIKGDVPTAPRVRTGECVPYEWSLRPATGGGCVLTAVLPLVGERRRVAR
jgi:signal transduction histidine kinase